MKKSPLKRGKPLRKVGKTGQANIEANKRLKSLYSGVNKCELRLKGCQNWPLQVCHRHKRNWYKGDVSKLSDFTQTIIGCQNCHTIIENDTELTIRVFQVLRGDEN